MTLLMGMFWDLMIFLAASEVSLELGLSSMMRHSSEEEGTLMGLGKGILKALVRGFGGIFLRVRLR